MMKWVLSKKNIGEKGIESFNTHPRFLKVGALFIVIIIIILFLNFIPMKILLASNFKTNEFLKAWPIKNKESFTVMYTHSVELCPVSETYIIKDENIILTETYFESYGAGLPSTTPYKFEITETGFRIFDINELMNDLIYRTGAERANHSLIFKDKAYEFLDFSKPRTGVRFQIEKISALDYLIMEGL